MALVAALNTLGACGWSNKAAISCLWTGVLEESSTRSCTTAKWARRSVESGFPQRPPPVLPLFSSRPRASTVHQQAVHGPAGSFLRQHRRQDCAREDSGASGGSAHLHAWLLGVELQRPAAGFHPAQPRVLHLLCTPVLLLLTLLQTLLGHGFVLHHGGSWQEVELASPS